MAAFAMTCSVASAAPTDRQLIEQLVAEADAGRAVSVFVQAANERGLAAALIAAEFLDEQKPARAQAIYEVIGLTGNERRLPAEILRLYSPDAYSLFYTPEGLEGQQRLAKGLAWKTWPPALPEAVVRAAPAPTIEWLRRQAASATPELAKLRQLLPPLAWWLRSYHERAVTADVQAALDALAGNPTIVRDDATAPVLLRAIGGTRARGSLDFVLHEFPATAAETRGSAVEAAGQMLLALSANAERARALPEFIQLAAQENDPIVLEKIGPAAEAWFDEPKVGQVMLDLFTRIPDAPMQRNILFAVGKTRWPQRGEIIRRGLETNGNGVLGVALEAAATHPSPELAAIILPMLDGQKQPHPGLIDAAGALGDRRALPTLLRWLDHERNSAMQIKLALALEQIPGVESDRALSGLLEHSAEQTVVDALCRIASRRELKGATETLISLAEDTTAPLPIRGQAVWALGNYRAPEARGCLARLAQEPDKYFPSDANGVLSETGEQARLSIALARLRQGEPGLEQEITRQFERGTPGARLHCLYALAEMGRDHPVIATALQSKEFGVLLGGVKAAGAAAPAKYLARLRELHASPIIASLATSGLDAWQFPTILEEAIRAGEKGGLVRP